MTTPLATTFINAIHALIENDDTAAAVDTVIAMPEWKTRYHAMHEKFTDGSAFNMLVFNDLSCVTILQQPKADAETFRTLIMAGDDAHHTGDNLYYVAIHDTEGFAEVAKSTIQALQRVYDEEAQATDS